MARFALNASWSNESDGGGVEVLASKFVRMWTRLSDISDIFDGDWRDGIGWVKRGSVGEPIRVDAKSTDNVCAFFERARYEDPLSSDFKRPDGRVMASISRVDIEPAIDFTVRVGGARGESWEIGLSTLGFQSPGIPADFLDRRQMVAVLEAVVDVWDPRICVWDDVEQDFLQKPRLRPGPHPLRSRVEWQTSFGWCTYLDRRVVPVPDDVDWPEGVSVWPHGHGVVVQIGDDPCGLSAGKVIALRKAMGWPHI